MKITIRSWQEKDIPNLLLFANNEKVARNLRDQFPQPYTERDAITWIMLNKDLHPALNMAIVVDDKMAGGTGISIKDDIYRKNAEIGYWIGEPFWKKGIATEAVRQMVDHTFRNFEITRIYASTFDFNIASQKVLMKLGFNREARLRKALFRDDKYFDEIILSVLKEDYYG